MKLFYWTAPSASRFVYLLGDEAYLLVDLAKGLFSNVAGLFRAGTVDTFQIALVLHQLLGFLPDGAQSLHHSLTNGRLELAVNRKPIADWFREQWHRLRYGARVPQQEERKSRGFKL